MAYFKIIKFSEIGKNIKHSLSPEDYIPQIKIDRLIKRRNDKIASIDAQIKAVCNIDDKIIELKKLEK